MKVQLKSLLERRPLDRTVKQAQFSLSIQLEKQQILMQKLKTQKQQQQDKYLNKKGKD